MLSTAESSQSDTPLPPQSSKPVTLILFFWKLFGWEISMWHWYDYDESDSRMISDNCDVMKSFENLWLELTCSLTVVHCCWLVPLVHSSSYTVSYLEHIFWENCLARWRTVFSFSLSAVYQTCGQITFFALFIPSFDTFCCIIRGAFCMRVPKASSS